MCGPWQGPFPTLLLEFQGPRGRSGGHLHHEGRLAAGEVGQQLQVLGSSQDIGRLLLCCHHVATPVLMMRTRTMMATATMTLTMI